MASFFQHTINISIVRVKRENRKRESVLMIHLLIDDTNQKIKETKRHNGIFVWGQSLLLHVANKRRKTDTSISTMSKIPGITMHQVK